MTRTTAHPTFPLVVCRGIVIILLNLICITTMAQQGQVTGKLVDSKGVGIAHANVVLLKSADSSFTSAALSNESGIFSLNTPAAGRFFVRVTAIGFKVLDLPAFDIAATSSVKDMGTLNLVTDAKVLQDVSINSLR